MHGTAAAAVAGRWDGIALGSQQRHEATPISRAVPTWSSSQGVERVALASNAVDPAACSPFSHTPPGRLTSACASPGLFLPSHAPPAVLHRPPLPLVQALLRRWCRYGATPHPLRIAFSVPMTRISLPRLRHLLCLLPAEAPDPAPSGCAPEPPAPGMFSSNSAAQDFLVPDLRDATSGGRIGVNCSSGGAQMLACFRAGAINLIVHPAMAMGRQRQGVSAVQPVTSLPRAAFLDGAEDHDSGDDPTSPVVTCIGQVRKDKPIKTPPQKNAEVADSGSLKAKRGKLQIKATESISTPSSPRPSKWKQILGARGTVNPSQQSRSEEYESGEFYIDLNRFGSACSTAMQDQAITPSFGHKQIGKASSDGTFSAKPLPTVQTEGNEANDGSNVGISKDESVLGPLPLPILNPKLQAREEVLIWKRRIGACKPATLELNRRVLKGGFR